MWLPGTLLSGTADGGVHPLCAPRASPPPASETGVGTPLDWLRAANPLGVLTQRVVVQAKKGLESCSHADSHLLDVWLAPPLVPGQFPAVSTFPGISL